MRGVCTPRHRPSNSPSECPTGVCVPGLVVIFGEGSLVGMRESEGPFCIIVAGLTVVVLRKGAGEGLLVGMTDSVLRIVSA